MKFIHTSETDPRIKKLNRKNVGKRALFCIGYAVLGGGITGAIASAADFDNNRQVIGQDYNGDGDTSEDDHIYFKNLVLSYPQRLEEAEVHLDELTTIYGEVCVTSISPYTQGHILESTPEVEVMDDLAKNGNTSCGTDVTVVRTAVHDVQSSYKNLASVKEFDYNSRVAELKRLEDRIAADRADAMWETWGIIGGSSAFAIAALVNTILEKLARKEEEEQRKRDVEWGTGDVFHKFRT